VREADHIRPLTSLRFFAAMWVVLFHYWAKLTPTAEPALVAKGYLGVELFFVLSGFILCHVYLDQVGDGRFRYGGFLWARLARVYPLHLATLIGVGAMAIGAGLVGFAIDPAILSWRSLPANLLLLQAWGLAPEAGWNHPSWSISAEWFAYLSFPVFAWAALRLKAKPWIAMALAAALLSVLYAAFEALAGFSLTQATIAWGALRIVPCFALGCAAHLLWRAQPLKTVSAATAATVATLMAAVGLIVAGSGDAPVVILFGALIVCLASLSSAGSKILGSRILVYLGEISYAVYMVCIPWMLLFVNGAAKLLNLPGDQLPWPLWMVFFASVVPVAALAHHLVERPARDAMRRWAKAWTAPARSVNLAG
jgi:peptidoglycan/LPS O-acetylase OafA/YrhL